MARVQQAIAASVVVVALASGSALAADPAAGGIVALPAPAATLARLTEDLGGRGATRLPARYAYLEKLDGHLQDVAANAPAGQARAAALRQGVPVAPDGGVGVDVYVAGDVDRAADRLRALGMNVSALSKRAPQRLVEGSIPADALPAAAALDQTRAIGTPLADADTGSVLSEGDAAVHGPQARLLGPSGVNGAGVLVGIISDSINQAGGKVASSQATGDLPANVQVIQDFPTGADEGRAMAEIVYDEAPGISGIAFSTGFTGAAGKAASIDNLVAAGAKVIADDISYFDQPMFQDGIITQAADRAKAAGTAYFVSAGNYGTQSWEGVYSGGTTEDFDPSGGVDTVQTIGTVPANSSANVVLQWAEPWGRAATDFAIDLYNISSGNPSPVATADSSNLTSGLPTEFMQITNSGGAGVVVGIAIRRVAGTGTPLLKYLLYRSIVPAIQYATSSSAISFDAAAAKGAMTVAASEYTTPTTPEGFSSRGPVTHYFDVNGAALAAPEVRQKPEITSADGVSTSVGGNFSPFFGTSAAAPSAAGIAALIRSAKPLMGVDELYAIMASPANALDCPATAGNPDIACGVGFVLADRALAMALDPTPPVITPVVTPAAPDGANGWYRTPASVTWSVSDPESPVVDVAPGCAPAAPGEGAVALTCSAASAGGTASIPLELKRDTTAPTAPTISGIQPKAYPSTAVPKAAAIACSASDTLSGIASCAVTGYAAGPGTHVLTAVATNGAGATSSTTLSYSVAKPAAISAVTVAKSGLTLARLSATGLVVTTRVAVKSTRLTATLVARVPKASGSGTVRIALASLSTRAKAGTVRVRVKLTPKAKLRLSGVSKATLELTLSGSTSLAKPVKVKRSFVVRR